MKNTSTIISNITKEPCFRPLQERLVIEKFISFALSSSLKKGIEFFYIKNGVLFFALSHPSYLQEFKMQKKHIESMLEQFLSSGILEKQCDFDSSFALKGIVEIKFFVARAAQKRLKYSTKPIAPLNMRYLEISNAEFENRAKSPKLREIFEKIRAKILEKIEKED